MPTQPTNASSVVLRGGGAQRADPQLGPTRFARGAKLVTPPTADPATLSLTGWWGANYAGSPWAARASASSSLALGDLTEATTPPATGAVQNSLTPADFDGVDDRLTNGNAVSSCFVPGSGSIVALFLADTAAAPSVGYDDPSIFADAGGYVALAFTTSGARAYLSSGGGVLVDAACATGAYHCARVRWNGTTLGITVDNGVEQTIACGNADSLSGTILVGASPFGGRFDGRILYLATALGTSDADWQQWGRYFQERSALSLGFPAAGPYLVPSTAIDVAMAPPLASMADVFLYPGLEDEPPPPVLQELFYFGYGVFPEAVSRLALGAAWQQAQARHESPIVVAALTPLPDVDVPTAVQRSPTPTPAGGTVDAKPERVLPVVGRELYPDAVARLTVHASSLQATAIHALPERPVQFNDVIAPSAIDRRWLPAGAHLALSGIPPLPDARRTQFAEAEVYPDAIARPTLPTGSHQATTIYAFPDTRKVAFVGVTAPDAAARVVMAAAAQLALAASPPFPDARTIQFGDAIAPAAIDRVRLPTGAFPFATSVPAFPDSRTLQFVGVTAPSAIDRATFRAAAQLAPSSLYAFPDIRTQPFVGVTAPASIDRLIVATAVQSFGARPADQPPPSLVVTFAEVDGPSQIARTPSFATFAPFDGGLPVRPEQAAARDARGVFPDAVDRVVVRTAAQLAFVSSSKPEQTVSFARADGPSEVRRPTLHASALQFLAAPSPRFENTVAIDVRVVFPDTIARLTFLAERQQSLARVPQPERQVAFIGGDATFPAAVDRIVQTVASRQAVAWHAFPDARRVPMVDVAALSQPRVAPATGHLLIAGMGPIAPPSVAPVAPTFFDAEMPAALPSTRAAPTSPVGPPQQPPLFAPSFFSLTTAPSFLPLLRALPSGYVAPPTHAPLFAPSFFSADGPATIPIRIAQQPSGTAPGPVVLIVALASRTVYPDAIARDRFAAAAQLAVTEISPKPERKAPLASIVAPDRIDRAKMPALGLEATTFLTAVVTGRPLLLLPVYPDFARAPAFDLNAHRTFATAMWPNVFTPGLARVRSRAAPYTIVATEAGALTVVRSHATPLTTVTTTREVDMQLYVGAKEKILTRFTVKNDTTNLDVPTDPTTLTLEVTDPDDIVTSYVYLVAAEVSRLSVGYFRGLIDCTKAGHWKFAWIGTGAAQCVDRSGYFDVLP